MSNHNVKRLAILTSGGDAPGMNACIRACVRYALTKGYEVYGVGRGYVGLLEDDIFPMDHASVTNIVQLGGTIIRTGRSKEFACIEGTAKALENLKRRGIENLIVIGGDGSFHGVQRMYDHFGFNAVGIPGTIDNDMGYTDYTIGFDTACNTVLSAILSLRDTIASHDRIMVLEVMGRNCGDIALWSGLAGGAQTIVCPEETSDIEKLANEVNNIIVSRHRQSALVVVAEGCKEIEEPLMKRLREVTGRTVNFVNLSYVQRGGSPTMLDRVLAARFAIHAVDLIEEGKGGRAVGIDGRKIIDVPIADSLYGEDKEFNHALYSIANIISK